MTQEHIASRTTVNGKAFAFRSVVGDFGSHGGSTSGYGEFAVQNPFERFNPARLLNDLVSRQFKHLPVTMTHQQDGQDAGGTSGQNGTWDNQQGWSGNNSNGQNDVKTGQGFPDNNRDPDNQRGWNGQSRDREEWQGGSWGVNTASRNERNMSKMDISMITRRLYSFT